MSKKTGDSFFAPFCLGNPLLLSDVVGKETCTDEDGVLSTGRIVDLHADFSDTREIAVVSGPNKLFCEILSHAGSETGKHGGTAIDDDVLNERKEVLLLAHRERFVDHLADTRHRNASYLGVEEHLSCLEALRPDLNGLTIGKRVLFVKKCCLTC